MSRNLNTALCFVLLPLLSSAGTQVRDGSELAPDVSTFAGIDAALEGRVILASDAVWRYFPGDRNPSSELEWTQESFDDSTWPEGAAPFGVGAAYAELGTRLPMGISALYLRRTLVVADRASYARVLLELPIDDGYVLFVNGREEDRQHADKFDTYHPFDSGSTSERKVDTPPCPTIDLTKALRTGVNTLAIQVLTHSTDRDSLAAYPRVRVLFDVTPTGEKARRSELSALLAADAEQDRNNEARRNYLEGRHRQRLGKPAEAVAFLEHCADLLPTEHAPWRRLTEACRGARTLPALDAALLQRLASGARTPAMLDTWARLALGGLRMSSVEFAARVPLDAGGLPEDGPFAEALWSGRGLAEGRALMIDCGASVGVRAAGSAQEPWGKDRCFAAGTKVRSIEGQRPRASVRVCARSLEVLVPAYRVPVATGAYEVVLHFAASDGEARAAGEVIFDLALEGARVARAIDPAVSGAPSSLRFPVFVRDGFLDVDLLPRTDVDPWLAGLEVHPLPGDEESFHAFQSAAAHWVDRTKFREAFPIVLLAENALAWGGGDDTVSALTLLEEAEALPDFRPADGELLARVRDRLLPDVLSLATVDDLVERRSGEAESILTDVRAAGNSDRFVSYFEGRIHQRAERFEDAIAAFEGLVFGDAQKPLPVLRMAECLASAKLGEEAFGILAEAFERGVPRTPALLQLWISLQIGPLERDPWDVVDRLGQLAVPEELIVVPTSEHAARTWKWTNLEPPAIAWSRPSFNDSAWREGPGMLGNGNAILGTPRSHSDQELVFGRRSFTLTESALLYPYFDVYANDAAECYLNGTLVSRISAATDGYVHMPVRPAPFTAGVNLLGEVGFNARDAGMVDAGIMQPLGELIWIKRRLDESGALRINCGGGEVTTADGKEWSRDRFYGWARASEEPELGLDIQGTEDDVLYRTNRWFYDDSTSAFYQIPLPNGPYRVTLHFAEIDEKYRGKGARTFDVRLEHELVAEALDVVAEAGFAAALVLDFAIEVRDGWFDLLINDLEQRSFISAFAIEYGTR